MKSKKILWIFLLSFLATANIIPDFNCCCASGTGSLGVLSVHFIDVGYGDSILVEFPCGGNMLIDGGDYVHGYEVVDYLKKMRIENLDIVVVTHPHPDHIEGLFRVMEEFKVAAVIANEDISESKNYADFFRIVKKKEIKFKQGERGDIIDEFKGVKFKIIHPDKLTGNSNNDSLVIKVVYKKISFLFAADIGRMICDRLAKHYREGLKSNVLTVPHHGKSGSDTFFRMVSPDFAVISTGTSRWRNPKQQKEMLNLLKKIKSEVLFTERQGTIVFKTDGEKIWE